MLMKASTFEVCSLVDQPYADNLMLLRSCSQRGLDESAVETIGGQHFLMIDYVLDYFLTLDYEVCLLNCVDPCLRCPKLLRFTSTRTGKDSGA
jgi:hypothetical protein